MRVAVEEWSRHHSMRLCGDHSTLANEKEAFVWGEKAFTLTFRTLQTAALEKGSSSLSFVQIQVGQSRTSLVILVCLHLKIFFLSQHIYLIVNHSLPFLKTASGR